MKFHRPRSLNGLILVGFGLVAAPLLLAIIWALFNLDKLAEQSEQLVITGVTAAEQNRLLFEQIGSLERVARQHAVLQSDDSRELLRQDFESLRSRLSTMIPLTTAAAAGQLGPVLLVAPALVARGGRREGHLAALVALLAEQLTLREAIVVLLDGRVGHLSSLPAAPAPC